MNLKGKTAQVTGASRGIGPHLAAALAGRDMNLTSPPAPTETYGQGSSRYCRWPVEGSS
jgi:hypothetical protein